VAAGALAVLAPPALAGNGGVGYTATPKVTRIKCLRSCASRGRTRQGGVIRLLGSGLSGVTQVTFMGGRGRADDVKVKVRPRSDRWLRIRVPWGADSGPLGLVAGSSVVVSARTAALGILPARPPPPTTGRLTPVPGPAAPGAPRLETATSTNVAFAGSSSGVTFSYRISASSPVPVEVDLVRQSDGATVQAWQVPSVQPGSVNSINWQGVAGGQVQPDGVYAWRLTATGASGATARSAVAADPSRDSFALHDHIFPVRGRHTFGDGFGVQRQGHTHQGQDILARCGLRIASAEAGTVLYRRYQSAAGNYLVVHGDETGVDYAYMHMRAPSPFMAGDHVTTGETIGNVGDTGDATACHLHFEMWTAPGWQNGGQPFDPLPSLEQWDAYS
jgi:murein DD-endopeptidase MepM/ murein hydrolase activator NlpD